MNDSNIIRPRILRWLSRSERDNLHLMTYCHEGTLENLYALVETLLPQLHDEDDYYGLLRNLLIATLPVVMNLAKEKIADNGWDYADTKSTALCLDAADRCMRMVVRWLHEMDRIMMGGNKFRRLWDKEDRQNRIQLHKLMREGIPEREALRQVFPADKNRRRWLSNWIKKGLWPITGEELELLETDSDS